MDYDAIRALAVATFHKTATAAVYVDGHGRVMAEDGREFLSDQAAQVELWNALRQAIIDGAGEHLPVTCSDSPQLPAPVAGTAACHTVDSLTVRFPWRGTPQSVPPQAVIGARLWP